MFDSREEMSMWFASLKETEDSEEHTERRQSVSPKQNSKNIISVFAPSHWWSLA